MACLSLLYVQSSRPIVLLFLRIVDHIFWPSSPSLTIFLTILTRKMVKDRQRLLKNPVLEKIKHAIRLAIFRPARESAACGRNKYSRLVCLTTFIVQVAGMSALHPLFLCCSPFQWQMAKEDSDVQSIVSLFLPLPYLLSLYNEHERWITLKLFTGVCICLLTISLGLSHISQELLILGISAFLMPGVLLRPIVLFLLL